MNNEAHKRSNSIGVISTGFDANLIIANPYFSAVLNGILRAAGDHGCNVTLFTNRWTDRADADRWFAPTPVDGFIVIAPDIHSDLIDTLRERGVPVVATSADSLDIGIPTVDTDDAHGAALATRHLIDLGHTRIAHLAGTMHQTNAFNRRDAFFNTMKNAGLEVISDFVIETGFSALNAHADATRLLSHDCPPTAIFAASDYIAYWAMQAARDMGIDVPGSLSIVGYDDAPIAPEAGITTIRQPLIDIGRVAANLLLQQISGAPIEATTHLLPAELVVRGTTSTTPQS